MPKKRTLNLKQYQSSPTSSSAQAGSSSHHGAAGGSDSTSSVNERLSALRQVERPETLLKKRELAALMSHNRSVPPELRRILGVPESAPPKPKIGVRSTREMRRTPGPAPPKSWLGFRSVWESDLVVRGGKAKRKMGSSRQDAERNRPSELMRFERMVEDGGIGSEDSGLMHLALKTLAQHWDLFDEEDYPALAKIPLRLRLRSLTYLGLYGPTIDAVAFRALTAGTEAITHLDLAGLAGYEPFTIKKLAKALEPVKESVKSTNSTQIADSWDAEETIEAAIFAIPTVSRFSNLTHLCLSHPPSTASWKDLLVLTKQTPQVTHISLAYWPRPTLTPNLAAATVSSKHSPDIHAGGSNYYSGMDQEFKEPALLLRQLSANLLSLQWLDLEGCAAWMPALAMLTSLPSHEQWSKSRPNMHVIFMETWQNLTYINCAQGWLPTASALGVLANTTLAGLLELEKENFAKYRDRFPDPPIELPFDDLNPEKRWARMWKGTEARLFAAGRRINNLRRANSSKPVTFDFGWLKKAV